MNQTTPHPIDFATLDKGRSISVEEMEAIFGFKRDDNPPQFQIEAMNLVRQIERECEALGKLFTVAQIKGAVRILTDDEASDYNRGRHEFAVRTMAKSLRRLSWVDTSKLESVSREKHEHAVDAQARQIAALYYQRKQLGLSRPMGAALNLPEFTISLG